MGTVIIYSENYKWGFVCKVCKVWVHCLQLINVIAYVNKNQTTEITSLRKVNLTQAFSIA